MRHSAQTSPLLPDEPVIPEASAPPEIEYAPAVMEAVRAESVSGLMRLRGGIEVGGVLYGRSTPEVLRILAVRPLDCEHRFGPSFVLSDKDEELLRQMLDPERHDEETRGLEPVGWYVSHCRRTFALEESDIRIFDRYFPKVGSATLIVIPEKIKPTRACFFVRDPHSTLRPDVPSCEVLLPSPIDLALAGSASLAPPPPPPPPPQQQQSMVPSITLTPPLPETALVPVNEPYNEPVDSREIASRRLNTFLAQQEKHRRVTNWNLWATIIILLMCMGGAGYLWMRSNASDGAPAIPLHVSDSGPEIRIEWDARQRSVESANSGVLEMREADGAVEQIKLPPDALRTGSAFYTRRTDKVEIRLKLVYSDRPAFESVVYFIKPLSVPVPQTTVAAAVPQTQTQPPPVQPAQTTIEIQPVQPRPVQARVFQPPVATRPTPSAPANIGSTSLPAPEGTQPLQPATPALHLPSTPVVAPPPPPAPAPKIETPVRQEPAKPRSGRLIWTGELGRGALLSLSSAGASLGWVNGRLPGTPVRVSVHIAQLVEGGMEVYTDDPKGPPAEPPSAQNGWNIIVYKPDTKKIATDLRVVEAPAASNSWNHMVVQNGKHAVSVLVIDWVTTQ